jgi:hypothetical protein
MAQTASCCCRFAIARQASKVRIEEDEADDDVREELVFAIGEICIDAPPILAALQQALLDPSPTLRGAAQEALDKLQDDDDDDDAKKDGAPAEKPQNL